MKKRYAIPLVASLAFSQAACTDRDNEVAYYSDYQQKCQLGEEELKKDLDQIKIIEAQSPSIDYAANIINVKRDQLKKQLSEELTQNGKESIAADIAQLNLDAKIAEDFYNDLAALRGEAETLDNTLLETRETVKKLFPEKPAGFCSEAYRTYINSKTPTLI